MRRVILHEFGPYSNLVTEELPDPVPGDGQAVVAIEAAGIGFVDTLCVHGTYQLLPSLPWVPGCELAGRVIAVGDGLERLRGRRPRAGDIVRRQLPDPHRAARGRARVDPRRSHRRAGRRAGRVVRHDALRVHPPHDGDGGRVGRGAGRRRRHRTGRDRPRQGARREGGRVRVDAGQARAGRARGCRRASRLLRSRARPEGDDPRAHGRWRPSRRGPRRRAEVGADAPGAALRGPLPGDRFRRRRHSRGPAEPGVAQRPHRHRHRLGLLGGKATRRQRRAARRVVRHGARRSTPPCRTDRVRARRCRPALDDLEHRRIAGKVVLAPQG